MELDVVLTFYTNGAMRVEINDPSKKRFQIANHLDDVFINNSGTTLTRLENLTTKVREMSDYYKVAYVDEEFKQRHVYMISKEKLWISLSI